MSSKVTLLLSTLCVVLLAMTVLIVPDSFELKSALQSITLIVSGAYGKFLADIWTEQRRAKASKVERSSIVKSALDNAAPVMENFRSVAAKDSTKLIRDFIYADIDFVPTGGQFLKIIEDEDFSEHRLMIDQLGDVDLLNIGERETHLIQGKLSKELYEIL